MNKAKIIKISHITAIAALLGLIICLLIFSIFYINNNKAIAIFVLLIPLAIPLRGTLAGKRYTIAYSSLLSICYFLLASYLFTDNTASYHAIMLVATLISFIWFSSCLCYNRLTKPAKLENLAKTK